MHFCAQLLYRYGKNRNGGVTAEMNNCRFEKGERGDKKEMLLRAIDIIKLD